MMILNKEKTNMKVVRCPHKLILTLSNAKHGESIVIGLVTSSTSKGPQIKTAEPMVSIKVTYCSIQLN